MINNNLTIVMYHYVRDLVHSRYPRIHGLQIELFREQVQFLKKNYNFVTVEQILDAYENNSVRDLPEHPVLLMHIKIILILSFLIWNMSIYKVLFMLL